MSNEDSVNYEIQILMKVEMQKFMLIVPVDCGRLYDQCKFEIKAFK